jgi:hypothetical protein
MSKKFVTGFFKTRAAAEAAVDAIIKRGYTRDDISVLMSDPRRAKSSPCKRNLTPLMDWELVALSAEQLERCWPQSSPSELRSRAGLGLVVAGPIAAALPARGRRSDGGLIGCWSAQVFLNTARKVYDTGVRGGGILSGVETKTDERSRETANPSGRHRADNVRTE